MATAREWWRDAVIYQIYPRSFADADGDGIGDIPGIAQHLDYLRDLGVDAIWLSPFYTSPQRDAGYDVADYVDVDPLFGTLADFDAMLAGAHDRGLKVVVDLVPNHSSSDHAWFKAALASPAGSPERARYIFRTGRGTGGVLPPNNWNSQFGGPAWARVGDTDQWYLHLFDPGQPDLDWSNPAVVASFDDILRFWLDRGVDGFRVDVAHGLVKADGLPDFDGVTLRPGGGHTGPMWDQDGVHEIYRGWNAVLGEYEGDRMLVAEAWVDDPARLSHYVRPDEMQQAFNFIFMSTGWDAAAMRSAIDASLATNDAVGATTTWVLSNHDVVRHATRFGIREQRPIHEGLGPDGPRPDAGLGLARARAATLLMLALPGSAYLYQGEELGLPEAIDLPASARQDPKFFRTNGENVGRDGARVPLPWKADAPGYGFGPSGASWLPQPDAFREHAADAEAARADSTLNFYRAALRERSARRLGDGSVIWLDGGPGVLAFETAGTTVFLNAGDGPVALPDGARIVVESSPGAVREGVLSPDHAVWITTAP